MKTEHRSTQLAPLAPNSPRAQNHSIPRRWFTRFLGAFLCAASFALTAAPVQAEGIWQVSGQFTINQGKLPIRLDLQQRGETFTGTASFYGVTDKGTEIKPYVGGRFGATGTITGKVTGTVNGDSFDMEIAWNNGQKGIYMGAFTANSGLQGEGFEVRSPSVRANWRAARAFERSVATAAATPPPKVLKAGPKPTPPPPKVLKASGKPKTFLTVNPVLLVIPAGQTAGHVTLSWNAGPGHATARIRMYENGGGRGKTVAIGQDGSTVLTLAGGMNYSFTLSDQGEEIAKAAVITKR